jgi:hypothetical protein
MKPHRKRKPIRTVTSIIDTICFNELIIVTLWLIALSSLGMAIYQEVTK